MVKARPARAPASEDVRHLSVGVRWLLDGELRLDASHYSERGFRAQQLVEDSTFKTQQLGDLSEEVFAAPISRRHFSPLGALYLTPTEVFHFRYEASRRVVKHLLRDPERWMVRPGWILVTQSGSVGRVTFSTDRLRRYVVSQNIIRIVPKNGVDAGYVYGFLASWIGQALLSRDKFGAAIKHLQPHHLKAVKVPLIPKRNQGEISRAIQKAYAIRDRANELLDEADHLLHDRLALEPFDRSRVEYFDLPGDHVGTSPRGFAVSARNLQGRFDASFHIPEVQNIRRRLGNARFDTVVLDALSSRIFIPPRFRRTYVESRHGVPFLQGSHLPQLEPRDLKYISRSQTTDLDEWLIRPGWVLVTRSGTVGRVGYTSSFLDGWAASEHILRIVADEDRVHPGYIAGFLMSAYGNHQLTSKIYGGVVDELTAEDTAKVVIPDAPHHVQVEIGELVTEAFELKDQATRLEHDAIERLEQIVEQARLRAVSG